MWSPTPGDKDCNSNNCRSLRLTAKMIVTNFPLKKLLRNGKDLLLGMILLFGVLVVFYEMVEMESWGECVFLLSNNMSSLL